MMQHMKNKEIFSSKWPSTRYLDTHLAKGFCTMIFIRFQRQRNEGFFFLYKISIGSKCKRVETVCFVLWFLHMRKISSNVIKLLFIYSYLFSIKPGSVLLLTFWPAVEDDDKKVRVTLRVPFDTQVRTILFHFTGILQVRFAVVPFIKQYLLSSMLLISGSRHNSGSYISCTWTFSCRI